MKCNHCNFEVAEGMKFCPKCGNPISNHDGIKQPNVNHQDVSSKKRNWFVSAAILVAIILGLFLLKGILTSKVNLSEIGECYEINGVKYPSYSQLRYIALNDLSHEEVGKIVSMCGLTQTEISGSSSRYKGDCGDVSLQIIKRDRTQYNFDFHPRSKEYMKMLKEEIMREEDSKVDNISPTFTNVHGYTIGYWFVQLNYLKDDDMSFSVYFWDNKKYRQ